MHVMIDLETLSTSTGAAVLQIGAVEFDPFGTAIGDTFNRYISLQGCNRHIDIDTVLWWMSQSPAAIGGLVKGIREEGVSYAQALAELAAFVGNAPGVWSHGATFDLPILRSAAFALGINIPWKYWNEFDTRTVYLLKGKPKLKREGVHHNALDDAVYQAKCIQERLCS